MGVLPLQFTQGQTRKTLKLDGSETFSITGLASGLTPGMSLHCTIKRNDGSSEDVKLLCRIDTSDELEFYQHGGILQYVLRQLM